MCEEKERLPNLIAESRRCVNQMSSSSNTQRYMGEEFVDCLGNLIV
jgi:hypothetical protein